jgi:hypothetical protein
MKEIADSKSQGSARCRQLSRPAQADIQSKAALYPDGNQSRPQNKQASKAIPRLVTLTDHVGKAVVAKMVAAAAAQAEKDF